MNAPVLSGIVRACAVLGSQRALSMELGVTEQAVGQWCARGWVPPARAREIEHITGVPRRELIDPTLIDQIDGDPLHYL